MPASKGKKGRKVGRNKVKCDQYRKEGRKEKNKLQRIRKHGTEKEYREYAKKHNLTIS